MPEHESRYQTLRAVYVVPVYLRWWRRVCAIFENYCWASFRRCPVAVVRYRRTVNVFRIQIFGQRPVCLTEGFGGFLQYLKLNVLFTLFLPTYALYIS